MPAANCSGGSAAAAAVPSAVSTSPIPPPPSTPAGIQAVHSAGSGPKESLLIHSAAAANSSAPSTPAHRRTAGAVIRPAAVAVIIEVSAPAVIAPADPSTE